MSNEKIQSLDAQTFAKHLAKPEGPTGISVTAGLNRTNAGIYAIAADHLELADQNRLLEIGFGNGHEIPMLLSRSSRISYVGIDYSPTMIAHAGLLHAELVQDGEVTLIEGVSSSIPFADGSFDRALALNTIYFWPQPHRDLAELRRVLRSGGKLVLGALAESSATREFFRHGFTFYTPQELRDLMLGSGFDHVEVETFVDQTVTAADEPMERDYIIVTAA